MAGRERIEDALIRWQKLEMLQEAYPEFKDFVYDGMTELMGFQCSPLQQDIAEYLQKGPTYRMVQAQRGQAKTSIVAFYSVWRIIHNPATRTMIFSAGGDVASEISNWIVQIIRGWEILECLVPDTSAGDRSSSVAYDVHHSLKGPEKSPSISCSGITANMQGRRADIVIADDIESSKNAMTEVNRASLEQRTNDFSSICATGDIIYLGTPQTQDSIYNRLPGRGFDIRIWPGRYPNKEEIGAYGEALANFIRNNITEYNTTGYGMNGDRGAPTDPIIQNEESLKKKEMAQGPAYFQLQYMLDTSLMDKNRYPLKTKNLVVTALNREEAPTKIKWMPDESKRIHETSAGKYDFFRPFSVNDEMEHYTEKMMYVDPSGSGDDETAYAVVYMLHGTLFLMEIGGVAGGFTEETFKELSAVSFKHKLTMIQVESNFAAGGFTAVWKPILDNYYEEWSKGTKKFGPVIEDDRATIQKEVRIIDTLEPILARHSLIVDEEVIREDTRHCSRYPHEKRKLYSLFFQMEKITREKGCLRHDDRLDALSGACSYYRDALMQNSDRMAGKSKSNEVLSMMDSVRNNGFKRLSSSVTSKKSNTPLAKYGI